MPCQRKASAGSAHFCTHSYSDSNYCQPYIFHNNEDRLSCLSNMGGKVVGSKHRNLKQTWKKEKERNLLGVNLHPLTGTSEANCKAPMKLQGSSHCFPHLILATQTQGQLGASSTGATSTNATSKLLKVEFPGNEISMFHIAKQQLYSLDLAWDKDKINNHNSLQSLTPWSPHSLTPATQSI